MREITDWSARMKEMMEFVGLATEDLELVRSTAPIVINHAESLTSAVYQHFLQFPEARRFFLGGDGEVDLERVARRQHSLVRWLQNSIELEIQDGLPVFLLSTGLAHSHPPEHRAHLGPIPARYMIGTISFTQTALCQLLQREMDSPTTAMRASVAWSKLLMVQLDVLLAGYFSPSPEGLTDGG